MNDPNRINHATAAAIRAVVSGLHQSGAITKAQVQAVVSNFERAEPEVKRWGSAGRSSFRQLCMDIANDAEVETSFKSAEDFSIGF